MAYKPIEDINSFVRDEINVNDFKDVFTNERNYEQFSTHAPLLVTKALEHGRITLTDELMTYKNNSC